MFRFSGSSGLDEAFRVLEALEVALLAMEDTDVAPGLRREHRKGLRTVPADDEDTPIAGG